MNSNTESTEEYWEKYIKQPQNNNVQYSYTTSTNPNYPIYLGNFLQIEQQSPSTNSNQDSGGEYYYGTNSKIYEFEYRKLSKRDLDTLKIATEEQIEKFNSSKGKTIKEFAEEGRAAAEAVSEQLLTNARQYLNDVYIKKQRQINLKQVMNIIF